ncbi:MAG: PilZ domain-containing protein [Chloroflexi bacterium]|nr:PilZ domain-containing protein [Chloroflexota bacterium]
MRQHQRRHPRLSFAVAVELQTETRTIRGSTRDISTTGLYMETSDELAGARPDLVTYERVPGAEHVHAWNMDPDRYESAVESFLGTVAGG